METGTAAAETDFTYTTEDSKATITKYNGSETELIIPDTLDGCEVVAIGKEAFKGNALVSVVIPDTVTEIGQSAFSECSALTTVKMPDGVTEIKSSAFFKCKMLTTIDLPKNLKRMEGHAFGSCEALEELVIPKTLEYASSASGTAVFENCGLTTVTVEEGLTKLPEALFRKAEKLTSVTLPDTVTEIGKSAFSDCAALEEIRLPDQITLIQETAFFRCVNLAKINLPKNLNKIEGGAFQSCTALRTLEIPKSLEDAAKATTTAVFDHCGLETVTFEEGSTKVPEALFRKAENLKNVVLADTITEIEESAFYGCTALPALTLPDSVTAIGSTAFANCSVLAEIHLSKSLLSIGDGAFMGCTALKELEVPKSLKEVVNYNRYDVFQNCGLETVTFEDGATRVADYLFRNAVNLKSVTLPQTVTEIGQSAFRGCTDLSAIALPDAVTVIMADAFYGCTGLAQTNLPKSLLKIEGGAFNNCTSLTEIAVPMSLEEVGGAVFYGSGLTTVSFDDGTVKVLDALFQGCSYLNSVTMPDTVTEIGAGAFKDCVELPQIRIPGEVTAIGDSAFENCAKLAAVVMPDSVTTVGSTAFAGCGAMAQLVLSCNAVTIGKGAFRNCTSLPEVEIPKSLTSGDSIFDGCSALKKVAFEEERERICAGLLKGCSGLEEIEIPDTVTEIGDSAFAGCSALKAVALPDSVTDLGSFAFQDCTLLAEVTFSQNIQEIKEGTFQNSGITAAIVPESVASIGDRAFRNCTSLAEVMIPDSVHQLGEYVFADCVLLQNVTLGTRLTRIPSYTFYQCSGLEKIVLPYSVREIENYAFAGCTALADITIPRTTKFISDYAFGEEYPENLMIRGVRDTTAHEYARDRNILFEEITIPATEMKLSPNELSLYKGQEEELFLSVKPIDFTEVVTWRSADETVAAVSEEGIVTAVGVGETEISVKIGDGKTFSDICTVTVMQSVESIRLDQWQLELEAWDTYTLTAEISPADALNNELAWRSSDPAVAAVDQDGTITALTKGTATIYAEAQDGGGASGSCVVTVVNSGYRCARPEEMESVHDYLPNCTDFWVYTREGAEKLVITFDELTEVEEGYDYICIYDGTGRQVGRYTGRQLADQTIEVSGDTVKIRLITDERGNMWGFKVVSIEDPSGVLDHDIPAGGSIPEGMWIAGIAPEGYVYTGSAIKPDVRVYDGSRRLRAGTDYTITYKNNTKANDASVPKTAPTITVKGKGNYSETVPVTFKINKADLGSDSVTAAEIVIAPNGKVQKKVPAVLLNGKKLSKGRDFTVTYPDTAEGAYKDLGNYTITLTGNGNFTGVKNVNLRITDLTLIEKAKIAKIPNKPYDNANNLEDYAVTLSESDLVVYMKSKNTPLKAGEDYTVAYENNMQIGTATVIITGMGKCIGTKRATFKITGTSIARAKVTGISNKTYNGEAQTQKLTVTLNQTELAADKDYKVTYDKNLNAGTARITITGVGKYTGTVRKTFKINPYQLEESMIAGPKIGMAVKYGKGGSKPEVTLRFKDEKGIVQQLTEGTDYKVTYSNNGKIAAYTDNKAPTITIKGNGNFKGKLTRTFTIVKKALNDPAAPVGMTIADVGAASGAGKYISKPVLTDTNGKALKANTDYTVEYRLGAADGVLLDKKSKVEADQEVYVTVSGIGKYTGTLKGRYRVAKNNFQKVTVKIDPQSYSGAPVTLPETAIHVTMKGINGELKLGTDFEIVEGSYVNNIKKGNASVTIRGLKDYGGTKTVKFKINTRKINF
ncbi:MAG: leucine-rich repeat protein [Bacteroidales bacterium]|nr:leucine-rich repeat protein [Bacteroidales bacterium]MCM1414333.1 leucine-rich repeat protein [bacterium]